MTKKIDVGALEESLKNLADCRDRSLETALNMAESAYKYTKDYKIPTDKEPDNGLLGIFTAIASSVQLYEDCRALHAQHEHYLNELAKKEFKTEDEIEDDESDIAPGLSQAPA